MCFYFFEQVQQKKKFIMSLENPSTRKTSKSSAFGTNAKSSRNTNTTSNNPQVNRTYIQLDEEDDTGTANVDADTWEHQNHSTNQTKIKKHNGIEAVELHLHEHFLKWTPSFVISSNKNKKKKRADGYKESTNVYNDEALKKLKNWLEEAKLYCILLGLERSPDAFIPVDSDWSLNIITDEYRLCGSHDHLLVGTFVCFLFVIVVVNVGYDTRHSHLSLVSGSYTNSNVKLFHGCGNYIKNVSVEFWETIWVCCVFENCLGKTIQIASFFERAVSHPIDNQMYDSDSKITDDQLATRAREMVSRRARACLHRARVGRRKAENCCSGSKQIRHFADFIWYVVVLVIVIMD
ncbi:hypothetical protein RFI_14058 [Reticulomyxa filosa]|uniref:Uncharacterized protein n=1 Tax=Reticulomyxa filosa TaxID=46433 RepID=X6NAQ7_RETFI|nr:hypothetical protein RFI_14058 [Reticulomyxa filosa]|eukprot:ETO23126.1 hypothetical protein RFI_14058 [Reticulomyxa filosa]